MNSRTLARFSIAIGCVATLLLAPNLRAAQAGHVVGWGNYALLLPDANTRFVAVSGGYAHTLALKSDGTVVGWGANGGGQCNVPASLSNVVAIAAGYSHSLA